MSSLADHSAMVGSHTSPYSSANASIDIDSLLNPPWEGPSTTPISHHPSLAARPNHSFETRSPPSHRSYPTPTYAWSSPEAVVWQSYNSPSKPYAVLQASPFDTFAQDCLPADVTAAPLLKSNGKPRKMRVDGRPFARDKYTEEELFFIWYHRVDLGLDWRVVLACFNTQFPNRQRIGFHGIQCALYRFIKNKHCPSFRNQDLILDQEVQSEHYSARQHERASRFGVIACTKTVRYPWMWKARQASLPASQGSGNHYVFGQE